MKRVVWIPVLAFVFMIVPQAVAQDAPPPVVPGFPEIGDLIIIDGMNSGPRGPVRLIYSVPEPEPKRGGPNPGIEPIENEQTTVQSVTAPSTAGAVLNAAGGSLVGFGPTSPAIRTARQKIVDDLREVRKQLSE